MNARQIESILIEIKKSEQNILKNVKQFSNQTFVIILGITGDGKSSLSNCLLRKDVIISKGAGNKVLLTGAGIKSGFQSCTKEPLITHDEKTNLVYCDCPGFDDNNGYNQEIINSFMINYLFDIKSNNKFKILLVISSSQIEASRGSNVISTIQRMINMFPKPEQLNKGLGIVITKGESELNGINYLEQLIDKSAPLVQNWCQYFISNPDCVFTFPMALRNKIGQKYEFDDHQRLIEFLKINPISNIIHKLTISEQATLYIKNMQLNLIQVFKDNLERIFNLIGNEYKKEKTSEKLKQWLNSSNQNVNSFIDLKKYVQKNATNYNIYEKYFINLDENEIISTFIQKIMCDNEIKHKSEQIIQSSFDFMKEELTELIKKAKTIELQEKKKKEYEEELRIKQKKAEEAKRKENELKRQTMEVAKKIDDLNQQTGVFNANQKNISCNYQVYSFDEIHFIYGNGFDAEARLINERKSHDIYPQIPNYCINLLMDGKSKKSIIICFNKKTRPHWTWFYFKPGFTKQNTIGTCDMNKNVVNLNRKTYQCDEKQILDGFDNIVREIKFIKERMSYDNYPQGAYYCIDTLSQGIENKKYVTMFIKRTRPHWTWFYYLEKEINQSFNEDKKEISIDEQTYNFDEIHFIYGNGFDAEARLINERKSHDIYPQVPNYCINLLMDGKSKQSIIICFNKKTRPHWTWFYFKPGFTKQNTIGTCDMNKNVVNLNGKAYQCDEKQILNGFDNIVREIKFIKERMSYDNYPQGAYYCIDILSQGIENNKYVTMFIKKTRPHWTWFYFLEKEMNQSFNEDKKEISIDEQTYNFDEIHFIYGNGFDVEARLINERKSHDIYPQVPNYCINLLMDGKSKKSIIICFNKKTRPHWTWFYFKPGFTKQNTIGTCDMNKNVVNLNGKTYQCDEKQILNGFDNIVREIKFIKERMSYDNYPQGAYYCIDTLSQGIENNKCVTMFIKKTRPHWTWFYFL